MAENEIRNRLNLMISAGHPIFIMGDTVAVPIEAEDFFAPEEIGEVQAYILSHRQGG